jgi:cbb3-type cytochrome oxidase subunit 3
MTDIHPIVPDPPKIVLSPVKVIVFIIILLGIVVFGFFTKSRSRGNETASKFILGEGTQTLESYLPNGLKDSIGSAAVKKNIVNPEILFQTGKQLVASEAEKLASQAGSQVEKVASDAAKNVTDFVYKNTIERIIDTLIQSLPQERQERYNSK